MDLESGDILYIEAMTDRGILLRVERPSNELRLTNRLTAEEARTLANALLAAAVEAEAHNQYEERGPR